MTQQNIICGKIFLTVLAEHVEYASIRQSVKASLAGHVRTHDLAPVNWRDRGPIAHIS